MISILGLAFFLVYSKLSDGSYTSRLFSDNVKFVTLYSTSNLSHYCSNKDPVPFLQKANVIYRLTCPGYVQHYIGKTDCSLAFRLCRHATRSEQPMFRHLFNFDRFRELVSFFGLLDYTNSYCSIDIYQAVHNNCEITDRNDNWSQLGFLEAFLIKNLKPMINEGLKASKELDLF